MITRSKARSRQSLGSVASPRANPPRRASTQKRTSQQSSGGVKDGAKAVGGRRSSLAGGRKRSTGQASSCNSSNCKTCPDLLHSLDFSSNVTGRSFSAVNVSIQEIHCKLQNFIYMLTCLCCNIQYVGETIIPMHSRMNIHRKGKTGCEIAINHYTNVCPGAKFSIRVLEKLPGNGYKNGKRDKEMYKYRLEREDFWMKKLRTIYPYGLNEKSKDMNKKSLNWPVGKLFPPLSRHGQRETENRNRTKVPALNPLKHFLNFEQHLMSVPVLDRNNEC